MPSITPNRASVQQALAALARGRDEAAGQAGSTVRDEGGERQADSIIDHREPRADLAVLDLADPNLGLSAAQRVAEQVSQQLAEQTSPIANVSLDRLRALIQA